MNTTWKTRLGSLALAFSTAASAEELGWKAVPVASGIAAVPVATQPAASLGKPVTRPGPTLPPVSLGIPNASPRLPGKTPPPAMPLPASAIPAPASAVMPPKATPLPVTPAALSTPTLPLIRAVMSEEVPFPPPPPFLQVAGTDPLKDSGPAPVPTPFPPVALSVEESPRPTSISLTGGPPDSVAPIGSGPELLPGVVADQPVGPKNWFQKTGEWFTWGDTNSGQRGKWCSDGTFPGLISPVTMPFFFEDPRALTEIRPIFMYQSIPSGTPNVGGGSAWFLGTQARLAFDDRFSLVLNELGILGTKGNNELGPINNSTGFAEVKIGPKYTFLKYSDWGSVAAAGLTFELPVGSGQVYQNTGTLGLTPYLSYGQAFGRMPGGYGSLNFMGTTGYSASLNNQRSEFFFLNLHLDLNVANMNSWFPFLEANWIQYTKSGNRGDFGFEGADLINFGSSTRAGSTYFSVAPGLRYRFNDHVFAGAAVEIPFSNEKGISSYRLTFDMIFRY